MQQPDLPNHDPSREHGEAQSGAAGPPGPGEQSPAGETGGRIREILATVGGQLEQLERIQAEHDAQLAELLERQRAVTEAERHLEEMRRTLTEERDRLNAEQQSVEETRETQRAHVETELAGVQGLREELNQQLEALRQRQEQVAEEARAIDVERASWEDEKRRRHAESQEHGAALEREIAERTSRVAEGEAELAQSRQDLSRAREEWAQRARATEEALEQRAAELDERESALGGRTEALAAEAREQAEAAALELAQEVEQERDRALRELADLRREHETLAARAAEAETRLADLQTKAEALEAELAQARSQPALSEADVGADVRAKALQLRIYKLERMLEEAQSRGAPPPPSPDHEAQIELIRGKAQRLAEVARHLQRRQVRLKRMRQALRERRNAGRPRAVVQPRGQSDSLDRHAAKMRELERARHELIEKRAILARSERRMVRRWARARSIVIAGWLLILAVLSGGVSWMAADHFAPAIVSASVTLEAKSRKRGDLDAEEAAAWQSWHAALIGDAAFRKTLAQRMDERRIEAYADVASLGARLDRDLSVDLLKPTEITLTLVGRDKNEVASFLDIVTDTILAESNRQARNRTDSAWAVAASERKEDGIVRYALPGKTPVKDPRLRFAAILFGGVLFFILVIVYVIYRHLIRVKREFDDDGALFEPAAA